MPAGFEVYNADGTLQFDVTNRLFRTLSVVAAGTTDGSYTIPAGIVGTVAATVSDASTGSRGLSPTVSIGGGAVTWSFTGIPTDDRANTVLTIEVY